MLFSLPLAKQFEMEEKNKKYEGKNSVIEFVEGWDMIQTLGEGAFGE